MYYSGLETLLALHSPFWRQDHCKPDWSDRSAFVSKTELGLVENKERFRRLAEDGAVLVLPPRGVVTIAGGHIVNKTKNYW